MTAARPVVLIGVSLGLFMAGLAALSYRFPYGMAVEDTPLMVYVALTLAAGCLWACLPHQIRCSDQSSNAVVVIILLGLAMRGAMFFSTPVLEDDSYRYLWDGAVTARGIDPYQYAPAEFAADPVFDTVTLEDSSPDFVALKSLAEDHPEPHSRINYPYVATIYPPLAQAAFAIAHWIDPFGLTGWRLVLLMADLITLGLLLNLLRLYDHASIWISLYWWNPVVILQGFGAGHMDVLVLPFLLGALLLARTQRLIPASLALVGGAAIKLWPILLFPLLVRPLLRQPLKLIMVTSIFGASLLLVLLPQLLHALRPEAGLNAYASEWRTHAFLFSILEDVVFTATKAPGQAARFAVAAIVIALTGYLSLRFADNRDRLPALFASVIAALIFLSPTGYPWYFIWIAPFLPFAPHAGVVSLFVLAPLYWLRFQMGDASPVYQWAIVPIAFGAPLILFALPYLRRRSRDAFRHHYPGIE